MIASTHSLAHVTCGRIKGSELRRSPVCLTTVGIKADKSLSAWAVHRDNCLVLVQLSHKIQGLSN